MQGAIFTGGVAEQDVHDLARFAASRPEAMDEGAGTRLVLFANGALKFAEEGFPILRRDLGEMIVVGPRLPLENELVAVDELLLLRKRAEHVSHW